MGTHLVRFMATLVGLLLGFSVLAGCAPQLPSAARSLPAPGEGAPTGGGFDARAPRRVHPGNLLGKADDPKDPVGKAAHDILKEAQKNGLTIVDAISASPTLSLRETESAAANGELTNVAQHPGSTFLGSIGEALVNHQIHQNWVVKSLPTVIIQPTKTVLPAALANEHPDLMVTEPGMCLLQLGIADVKLDVKFDDTIGPGTGGRAMDINLGPNTVISYWEITTSTQERHINDRADKVARWATKLGGFSYPSRACKCGKTTVHAAILAIDRGAYFNLPEVKRTEIVTKVTGAGGFIMLIRDLTKNSLQHANNLATKLKPVSRP